MISSEYWLGELEARVASTYQVYPVDSRAAFAEFEENGEITRLVHTVFAVSVENNDPVSVAQAVELIWSDIRTNYEAGKLVIWRRRPFVEEQSHVCDCCGSKVKQYLVRCRLGHESAGRKLIGTTVHTEGQFIFNLRKERINEQK